MPQAIAAAAADWFAFNVIGATVATAAAIETAVAIVATVAVNQVAMKVLGSSGQGGTADARALNTSVRQSAAPRRLIYGTVKAGGVLVYPAQSADGEFVHMAIYLGEGPIDGVESTWWVGDELSTDAKFTDLLTLEVYTGAPGQTASAALVAASGGEWTTADVGTGCAYVVTRYKWDRNAFPRGLVFPSFLVRGRRLYDPRTATTAHSSNPALVLLDYIRSAYGYAAPDQWIDFDSFAAAASVCDELVDSIDPANVVGSTTGKVRRYTLNGVFETTGGPAAVVATMEAAMAGKLVFTVGKYRAYAGAYRAPTGPVLTAEYLRADPTMRTHPGRQQRINMARGTYREPKQDWQTVDYAQQSLPAAVVAEDGEIVQNIDFPACTNGATVQRLARIAMRQARSAVPLSLPCNWAAFQWRLYDTVQVNIPEIGAVGTYLITSYTFAQGGGIDLVCVPHTAADYAWTPATDEQLVPVVVRPDFNSTPPTITGLTSSGHPVYASNEVSYLSFSATWTPTTWVHLKHYEVQFKPAVDTDWLRSATVTTPSWQTSEVRAGVLYDVRVRIVGADDTYGPWASTAPTAVTGDATPPGVPTSASVASPGVHVVTWTNPADLDFRFTRVFANGTPIAAVFGAASQAQRLEFSGAAGTVYTLASVDAAGNASSTVSAGTGATPPPNFIDPNTITSLQDGQTSLDGAIGDLDGRVTTLEGA